MAFSKADLYTTSGDVTLYHCWTENVTKYGSDTFYNWEQDNMPIHDLEERTFYLWEQLGYPTSSIPGVALVVSADAPDSACNSNIFKTVSAAVAALPQIINYPIIMEVANFGELGELRLTNHKFGPRGSLEIINRNFAKTLPITTEYINIGYTSSIFDTGTTLNLNLQKYTSSISYNVQLQAAELLQFAPLKHFTDSSAVAIKTPVFSSIYDSRLSGVGGLNSRLNGIIKNNTSFSLNKSTLFIGDDTSPNPFTVGSSATLNFRAYEYKNNSFDEVGIKDVSTLDPFNNNEYKYYAQTWYNLDTGDLKAVANGLFYGNKLSKIIVVNCDGPIYIRNFFVDGSAIYRTDNQYGVEISNCPNIYLESIVSTRFRKSGFLFNNSNVTLLRGCVGTRNYGFTPSNKRITSDYTTRIKDISFDTIQDYLLDDDAAGLIANNSVINVSSTSAMEFANVPKIPFGESLNIAGSSLPHTYYIYEFSKNPNGIILNNSTFKGGFPEVAGTGGDSRFNAINISIENNVGCGLKLKNSEFTFDGRLLTTENLYGIVCESSILEVDKLLVGLNQKSGIELINSVMKYNRNRFKPSNATEAIVQFLFSGNGQHLNLLNSKILPYECSAMDVKYGRMSFKNPLGVYQTIGGVTKNGILPSVSLKNNSEAILVHPKFERSDGQVIDGQACRGSELAVTNGSIAVLKGSKEYATKIVGPVSYDLQKKLAAVYAGANSVVEINGPTAIAQFGVDILGEDNSVINIGPHRDRTNGAIDVSSFSLIDPANHTTVELHSTRSCIVVNKLSTLNIRDLGSYRLNWNRTNLGASAYSSGVDYRIESPYLGIEQYVSGGFIQFYPNPNDSYDYTYDEGKDDITGADGSRLPYENFANGTTSQPRYMLFNPVNKVPLEFSAVTNGGMCVRAVNNSLVNLLNVNFPCGWWNPSSVFYDTSAQGENKYCSRLYIWNIADNSQIKASLLSVSGLFPANSGYIGPSGNWGSGTNSLIVASGLPATTPDTSSISILDYFGRTYSNPFGKSGSAENFGVFRLYFSVNPVVNVLTDTNSDTFGAINQIYSQGYQPSSNLVGLGTVSSLYPMLLQRNSSNSIVPSGYYYCSAMIDNPSRVRAYLDESAAETFANAKHCSVGKSGLPKLVSIYFPYNDTKLGDSAKNSVKVFGNGIKSLNVFDIERDN